MEENLLIMYGFARTDKKQPCIQEYITKKVCNDNHATFCSKFCMQNHTMLEYSADCPNGKGEFEAIGIIISDNKLNHGSNTWLKLSDFDIHDYRKALDEMLENSDVNFTPMMNMYGVPGLHIITYTNKI